MRYILGILGVGKTVGISPVYTFFVDTDSEKKKKVYKRAVSNAEKEQRDLISRYDREFASSRL